MTIIIIITSVPHFTAWHHDRKVRVSLFISKEDEEDVCATHNKKALFIKWCARIGIDNVIDDKLQRAHTTTGAT